MHMNIRNFLVVCLCLLLAACGYGREDDKEAARQRDIQEINQEMEQHLTKINSLKQEVSNRQASNGEDEQYNIMMAKLERAATSYRQWQEGRVTAPEGDNFDDRMQFYEQEEQRAQAIRHEMESAIQYVEGELQ